MSDFIKKDLVLPVGIVGTLITTAFLIGSKVTRIETRLDEQDKEFQEFKQSFKETGKELVNELKRLNEKVIVIEATTKNVETNTKKIKNRVE